MQKEKIQIPATRAKISLAKPMSARDKQKNTKEAINGNLLSNLDTSHPEIGRPIRELTGIASNKFPSSASLRLKNVFSVGIREAQVENAKPDIKK